MEKLEPIDTAGRNVKWFSCCGSWVAPQKYNTELSHDSAIPLLGIYPRRTANRYSKKYTYMNVYNSTVHKSFILGVKLTYLLGSVVSSSLKCR